MEIIDYTRSEDMNNLEIINKCNAEIKKITKRIKDDEFLITTLKQRQIDTIKNLYMPYSDCGYTYFYDYINMSKKDFIEKFDKDKYKIAKDNYSIIVNMIKRKLIGDTECEYNQRNLISKFYFCGYEPYGYGFVFTVNDITFELHIPNNKKLTENNFDYAYEGQYALSYKSSEVTLTLITHSYNLDDIGKAFRGFINHKKENINE